MRLYYFQNNLLTTQIKWRWWEFQSFLCFTPSSSLNLTSTVITTMNVSFIPILLPMTKVSQAVRKRTVNGKIAKLWKIHFQFKLSEDWKKLSGTGARGWDKQAGEQQVGEGVSKENPHDHLFASRFLSVYFLYETMEVASLKIVWGKWEIQPSTWML